MSEESGARGARSLDHSGRLPVTLACSECKTRNYKTTKSRATSEGASGPLELKKFCKLCKKHTMHRETK